MVPALMAISVDSDLIKRADAVVRRSAVYTPDPVRGDRWRSFAKELVEDKNYVLRGDCDDWGQTAIHLLSMYGVPRDRLYRAIVKSPPKFSAPDHMIGLVRDDAGTLWTVGDTFGPPQKCTKTRLGPHAPYRTARVDEHLGWVLWDGSLV